MPGSQVGNATSELSTPDALLRTCLVLAAIAGTLCLIAAVAFWFGSRPDVRRERTLSPDGRYMAVTSHVDDPTEGVFDAAWIGLADTEERSWHPVIRYGSSATDGEITAKWVSNTDVVFTTRRATPSKSSWGEVRIEVHLLATPSR